MLSHVFVFGMSRSGTTLLSTILDAHPDISMGYELLPNGIDDAAKASDLILQNDPSDVQACAARIKALGAETLAKFVERADRTLVSPEELAAIFRELSAGGSNDLTSLEARAALSRKVVALKAVKEGTSITGFKLNTPRIFAFDNAIGERAAYVYIVRDPRDVWRSHQDNAFDRTVQQVANTWNDYHGRFRSFHRRHPERSFLLRYEDLVQQPTESLDAMCEAIGLRRDPAMDSFHESKASVLTRGHGNSETISKSFFTSSVGHWDQLSDSELRTLESTCHEGMTGQGYIKVTDAGFRFPRPEWSKQRERLAQKRKYYRDEFADLMLPAMQRYPHKTWLEATTPATGRPPREVLVIRHDIDDDIENAVTMAKWEAEHDIRATYCVLHSAWYYGRKANGRTSVRSEEMVEACLEIQSLGHEVSLHNNAVAMGLRAGADPYEILAEELDFLRGRGLDIRGTSGHGDPLSKRLGFVNLELFSETVYPAMGGPRTIEYDGNQVSIGTRSMTEFGLSYEGYDLPRDIYISDSGGNLRSMRDTAGRAGELRAEMTAAPVYDTIVGILTHPVWWDLSQDAPTKRAELSFAGLMRAIGESPRRRRLWPFGR